MLLQKEFFSHQLFILPLKTSSKYLKMQKKSKKKSVQKFDYPALIISHKKEKFIRTKTLSVTTQVCWIKYNPSYF